MSDALSEAKGFVKSVRVFLAVSGAIALIAGILLLVWPGKTALLLTAIFASYLIIGGLVYIALGIFSKEKGGWARVGHIALGLLYIVAAVIAFANLPAATATLATVVVIFIGIAWIIDGIVSLSLIGKSASKVWTVIYAVLSLIAGVVVLFNALASALVLWWILGIALVVLGIVQIVRAITLGKDAKEIEDTLKSEA